MTVLVRLLTAGGAAMLLSGCAYDYLQHTDRVGYSAGDAVQANLAQATTNPAKRSMYLKGGLGKNGIVTKQDDSGAVPSN